MKKSNLFIMILFFIFVSSSTLSVIFYYNNTRLEYKYSDDLHGYVVTKAYGNSTSYSIPNQHKGKDVVSIGERAFQNKSRMTSVDMKNSKIKIISRLAFDGCKNLKMLEMPKSLETIEQNSFRNCSKLKKVDFSFSNYFKFIGGYAFYRCSSLDDIILAKSTYSIGSYAFSDCISLASIYIPDEVTYIYNDAFYNCMSLREVEIANRSTSYTNAFGNIEDNVNVFYSN